MSAPSGRVVLSDAGIGIDDADVLRVVGMEYAGDELLVVYTAACSVCEGHGFRHGRRCEWCRLDVGLGEYVDQPQVTLPIADLPALRAWARRQQFMSTRDGHDRLAEQLLACIAKVDSDVETELREAS